MKNDINDNKLLEDYDIVKLLENYHNPELIVEKNYNENIISHVFMKIIKNYIFKSDSMKILRHEWEDAQMYAMINVLEYIRNWKPNTINSRNNKLPMIPNWKLYLQTYINRVINKRYRPSENGKQIEATPLKRESNLSTNNIKDIGCLDSKNIEDLELYYFKNGKIKLSKSKYKNIKLTNLPIDLKNELKDELIDYIKTQDSTIIQYRSRKEKE